LKQKALITKEIFGVVLVCTRNNSISFYKSLRIETDQNPPIFVRFNQP